MGLHRLLLRAYLVLILTSERRANTMDMRTSVTITCMATMIIREANTNGCFIPCVSNAAMFESKPRKRKANQYFFHQHNRRAE